MAYVYFFAFVLLPFYFIPWTGLTIWYAVTIHSCESYHYRQYLRGFCLQLDLKSDKELYWYKDLWNHQTGNADFLDTLPSYIEEIMISHLKIFDAQVWLKRQTPKLVGYYSASSTAKTQKISQDLNDIIAMLSDLSSQWDSFSKTFCMEKDNVNNAFRALFEAYSAALTSNHHDLSIASAIFLPWSYGLRLFNHNFESWWLPEPRLYSFQVTTEIRFRMRRFTEESVGALDRIERISPGSNRFLTLPYQSLGAVINIIATCQHDLEASILETSWLQRIQRPSTINELENNLALAKHVHNIIRAAKLVIETNAVHSNQLRSQVQNFRKSVGDGLSIELSSTSVLTMLESSLSDHHGTSLGDLDATTLRSHIVKVCHDRNNIVPRELQVICFISAIGSTFASVDDDTLARIQRSWVIEREAAIHRYQVLTGTDRNAHIKLGLEIYQAMTDGTPIPWDM